MTREISEQPRLTELAARYLNEQVQAHDAGFDLHDSGSEVVLFEAGPVQAVDPRTAWKEAQASLALFDSQLPNPVAVPSFWGQLVASQEPAVALAFCGGNYPQLMRDWHLLLREDDLARLCPSGGAPLPLSLEDWIKPIAAGAQFPDAILALGCLRLARQFDMAAELVQSLTARTPASWQAAWLNELAALDWHQGHHAEAIASWDRQAPAVPVLFNRGMAALFLGKKNVAENAFLQANAKLPESSSWYHLGQLYRTFAAMYC